MAGVFVIAPATQLKRGKHGYCIHSMTGSLVAPTVAEFLGHLPLHCIIIETHFINPYYPHLKDLRDHPSPTSL